VTVDECADLPRGISILHDGEFHWDAGVTPLPAILQAMPIVLGTSVRVTPEFSAQDSVWAAGHVFSVANADRYHQYFVIARSVSILSLLGCALLGHAFAQSLYGQIAGLLTLTVVCFSPDMLAHGSLVTSDIFLATAIVGGAVGVGCFLRMPSWKSGLLLGVTVGLAALCKVHRPAARGFSPSRSALLVCSESPACVYGTGPSRSAVRPSSRGWWPSSP